MTLNHEKIAFTNFFSLFNPILIFPDHGETFALPRQIESISSTRIIYNKYYDTAMKDAGLFNKDRNKTVE